MFFLIPRMFGCDDWIPAQYLILPAYFYCEYEDAKLILTCAPQNSQLLAINLQTCNEFLLEIGM